MISRYTREEMLNLCIEENQFRACLEVEILAAQAWAETGEIQVDEVKQLRPNAKIDSERIKEIEAETRHDGVAFTRQISETLGPEKKWVHYGLTSTDVVD